MTTKLPLGMDFSSSGVMRGRSIICKLWLGSFLLLLTAPDNTVRLPSALESCSAVWLLGSKPPKMVLGHQQCAGNQVERLICDQFRRRKVHKSNIAAADRNGLRRLVYAV